ncbi:MAG TPA: CHRD domain-containing protein [Acidobacteriota bacterium]|nr:CHRD domain-containing protein [Acidobacteriota bacterium]
MLKKGFYIAICALFMTALAVAQPVSFDLTGDQEVDPVMTDSEGMCSGRLDALATAFSLDCTHNVGDAIAAHIHRAPAGVNGPIVFFLNSDTAFSFTVTAETLADQPDAATPISFDEFLEALRAGNLYVNVHTVENSGGEIRGQIPAPDNTLYFAQFGSGAGDPMTNAPAITSQITLLNTSATPTSGEMHFNGDDGNPVDVTVGDVTGSDIPFTIEGNGVTQIDLTPGDMLAVGSARSHSDKPLVGVIRFAIEGSGVTGVLGQGASTGLLAPVLVANGGVGSGGLDTGLAIQNAEAFDNTVTCELRDGDGMTVGMSEIGLDSQGHTAAFVTQLFEGAADFSMGFQGSVVCTSDSGFAMIALEQGAAGSGIFNAVPAVPFN